MKVKKTLIGTFFLVIILLIGLVYFYAGKFLVIDEKAKKSDVIIVLSGDRGARIEQGVELYHQGYGKYIMISGGTVYDDVTIAQLMKDHAMKLGVPERAIVMEDKADSTYENAVFSRELVQKLKFRSAIVVSSNYHMRRVKMLFDREYKHGHVSLSYASAADPNFNPEHWWSSNKSLMTTITEYIKLAGYALGKNS
ncbi:YdcF family protein [Bacillus songklensis]|uniref:YdcF family protein n=2 Tax=Bacillus songklensis TaxID=1069116 RepID=A0ABV8B638_9BACI